MSDSLDPFLFLSPQKTLSYPSTWLYRFRSRNLLSDNQFGFWKCHSTIVSLSSSVRAWIPQEETSRRPTNCTACMLLVDIWTDTARLCGARSGSLQW